MLHRPSRVGDGAHHPTPSCLGRRSARAFANGRRRSDPIVREEGSRTAREEVGKPRLTLRLPQDARGFRNEHPQQFDLLFNS